MSVIQLQLPTRGWLAAVPPCSECYEVVNRALGSSHQTGQAILCYNCDNRLTLQRIAPTGPSITDRLSAFERSVDRLPATFLPQTLAFQEASFFSTSMMEEWIKDRELAGFTLKDARMGWTYFARPGNSDAGTLVPLGPGVVGLVQPTT